MEQLGRLRPKILWKEKQRHTCADRELTGARTHASKAANQRKREIEYSIGKTSKLSGFISDYFSQLAQIRFRLGKHTITSL